MGQAKHKMEQQWEIHETAIQILMDVGCIKECPYHPGNYIEKDDDLQPAYAKGNSMITSRKMDYNRRDLSDAIKDAFAETLEECPDCAKWNKDD